LKTRWQTKASADDVKAIGDGRQWRQDDLDATKGNLQALAWRARRIDRPQSRGTRTAQTHGRTGLFRIHAERQGSEAHVGSMQVELRGASAKKHQFTGGAVTFDDMRLEKKNKANQRTDLLLHEWVAPRAMELSVNKVADKSDNRLFERAQVCGGHPRRPRQKLTRSKSKKANKREGPFGGPFFFSCDSRINESGSTAASPNCRGKIRSSETDRVGGRGAESAKHIVDFKEKSVVPNVAVREITSDELQMLPRLAHFFCVAQERARFRCV